MFAPARLSRADRRRAPPFGTEPSRGPPLRASAPRPPARRSAAGSDEMKLIEATRSARPSASCTCSYVNRRSSSGPNIVVRSKAPRQSPRCGGRARPMWRHELLDRLVDRILEHPLVPDKREPPARPQHAMDLGERRIAVEPVEGLGHRDRVGGRVGQRTCAPPSRRAPAPRPAARRASRRRAPPRRPRSGAPAAAASGRRSRPPVDDRPARPQPEPLRRGTRSPPADSPAARADTPPPRARSPAPRRDAGVSQVLGQQREHDEVLAHAVARAVAAQRALASESAALGDRCEASLAGFASSSTRSSPSSSTPSARAAAARACRPRGHAPRGPSSSRSRPCGPASRSSTSRSLPAGRRRGRRSPAPAPRPPPIRVARRDELGGMPIRVLLRDDGPARDLRVLAGGGDGGDVAERPRPQHAPRRRTSGGSGSGIEGTSRRPRRRRRPPA